VIFSFVAVVVVVLVQIVAADLVLAVGWYRLVAAQLWDLAAVRLVAVVVRPLTSGLAVVQCCGLIQLSIDGIVERPYPSQTSGTAQ